MKYSFFVLATVLLVAACQPKAEDATVTRGGPVQNLTAEIIEVTPGRDGSTVLLKDSAGKTYSAILSIPNLGPDSSFDFDHLKPGNSITISGDSFPLDGRTHVVADTAAAS